MKASNLQTPKPIARSRSRQIQSESASIAKHDKILSRSLDAADFKAEAAASKRSDLILDQTKKHDKIVRSLDAEFKAEAATYKRSGLIFEETQKHDKIAESDFSAESELILPHLPDPVLSPAESTITQEERTLNNSKSPVCTDLDASSEKSYSKQKYFTEINLIKKALEETNNSADISDDTKLIIGAMFEAATEQLKGETGKKMKGADYQIAKVQIGTHVVLIILLMWLILVRLIDIWSMDGQDWPKGLPPT